MRDRAWCGEHDRSLEFVTTDQERVCFSGLRNAETTCRIETANVTEQLLARARSDVVALVNERKAAEARLAQIAELLNCDWPSFIDNEAGILDQVMEALRLARGEEPA